MCRVRGGVAAPGAGWGCGSAGRPPLRVASPAPRCPPPASTCTTPARTRTHTRTHVRSRTSARSRDQLAGARTGTTSGTASRARRRPEHPSHIPRRPGRSRLTGPVKWGQPSRSESPGRPTRPAAPSPPLARAQDAGTVSRTCSFRVADPSKASPVGPPFSTRARAGGTASCVARLPRRGPESRPDEPDRGAVTRIPRLGCGNSHAVTRMR